MKKVLEAYETALKAVRGMDYYIKAMHYLIKNDLELGICHYCLNNDIDFEGMETYIFKTPWDCNTHSEIIESLQFRINYLKELIEDEKIRS
jgi:hypothetical protein